MAKNIVDLFCGAGGLSLGFEMAGFNSVLAIDFDQKAIETYNMNRAKKSGRHIDLKVVDEIYLRKHIEFSEVIGVIGGPPCQGFSIAGRRIVDDERNELYRHYFEIIEMIKPQFFLMENVSGLLTLSKGAIKEDILRRGDELGYNISFKVLDSVDYGVPQYRKRVFFVGIRKDIASRKFEFPVKNNDLITTKDALSDLPNVVDKGEITDYRTKPKSEYQTWVRQNSKRVYNHNNTNHTEETRFLISKVPQGGGLKDLPKELIGDRKYSSLLRRMDSNRPSNTIDTGHRTYFHYSENRIPSVRESARLQSFPDYFIFHGSKVEQYRQVGNAVPPLLAKSIANSILNYIKG